MVADINFCELLPRNVNKTKDFMVQGKITKSESTASATLMDNRLQQLEQRVHRLEQILEKARVSEPYVPDSLAQGEDTFLVSFQVYEPGTCNVIYKESFDYTWNEIFTDIAPCLMVEGSFSSIEKSLKQSIYRYLRLSKLEDSSKPLDYIEILCDDVRTIILQFKALKLISESSKNILLQIQMNIGL